MNKQSYPLSDRDIKIISPETIVITYDQLAKYKSLEQMFNKTNSYAILYREDIDYGHWVALTRDRFKNVCFFDSYGEFPDSQQRFTWDINDELGQDTNYLSRLLLDYHDRGYHVDYNEIPFQKDHENIATCGRYVALRCRLHKMTCTEFQRWLLHYKFPDLAVTRLTNQILRTKYS
jgi:hypothetical protein